MAEDWIAEALVDTEAIGPGSETPEEGNSLVQSADEASPKNPQSLMAMLQQFPVTETGKDAQANIPHTELLTTSQQFFCDDSLSQASTSDVTPALSSTAKASPSISSDQHLGFMKSYKQASSSGGGYGFIACEAIQVKYGRDVFISMQDYNAAGCPDAGTEVSFSMKLNSRQQPQAFNILVVDSTMKKASDVDAVDAGLEGVDVQRDDLWAIRKQVEWYFSDANLSTDQFFYNKIANAIPDGWLSVYWLLRCSKIRDLKATAQTIFEALRDSHLQTKVTSSDPDADMAQHLFVRRRQPLPPFVGREHKSKDGTVADVAPGSTPDPYQTMKRLRDQRVVQETLGLKEIGNLTTVFRELIGEKYLGPVLAYGYERVVYGDHGPYLEFTEAQINWDAWPHFHDKAAFGKLRSYDEYFTAHSFPLWQQRWNEAKSLTAGPPKKPSSDGLLMLYAQVQSVENKPWAPSAVTPPRYNTGYADYRESCYYMAANAKLVGVQGWNAEQYPEAQMGWNSEQYRAGPCVSPTMYTGYSSAPSMTSEQSVCWQWLQGKCWRGDACKWLHRDPNA